MSSRSCSYIIFNHLTQSYETIDGTRVSAEVVENCHTLADVMHVSSIREEQRKNLGELHGCNDRD